MEFKSKYTAHKVNQQGYVDYSEEENLVWRTLFERQYKLLDGRACNEYLSGLGKLQLTADEVPQLPAVSERLKQLTGWVVSPVEALISPEEFFNLLAERKFPAATFIRTMQELNYVQEPDIFHELFGHCPMLADRVFADFVAAYAEIVLNFPEKDWPLLQRFFWFTVEFGLINTPQGIRAYGGGILSSIEETVYCVESEKPERKAFVPLDIFRTPYRIDQLQNIYFVIDSLQQLYDFIKSDVAAVLKQAYELGEFAPSFTVDPNNPCIHILAC